MIRALDPEADLDFAVEMESTYFECDWTREDHRKQFQVPGCGGLIFEACGQRAAILIHQPVECGTYVRCLATVTKFRRRGYARQLMRRLIAKGDPLSLHVHEGNKVAQTLYKTLGFMVARRDADFYGEGEHALLMVRAW
jgi:ribosomal protein S18 acetylase RimI-like enzyme